jgi:oxygen-dependent protoporphyrinogen oxidase
MITETTLTSEQPDVIVIGGGIAGLSAALRLQDQGLKPLVLEADSRVGGRMTTDRVEGFSIDRGVTLLGNRFHHMRRLTRRLGLSAFAAKTGFAFCLQTHDGRHRFRAQRPDDLLRSDYLSASAKTAFLRLAADMMLHRQALLHGQSTYCKPIDDKNADTYLRDLGPGGQELFEKILEPGLKGPVGGTLSRVSRTILMQTAYNLLVVGTWNLPDGVDRIPEAIAAKVRVLTETQVAHVAENTGGVEVLADSQGEKRSWQARGAIFALPGYLVPGLCPDLPDWIAEPLARTQYAPIASAHVALKHAPNIDCAGYSFTDGVMDGVEIELEHLRAPGRCPEGAGLVSVYFIDSPTCSYLHLNDDALKAKAVEVTEFSFPECAGESLFVHLIRWDKGIAQFPAGRLSEMADLRAKLALWDGPYDFCGDYLDGLASEGALRTGEQAADRLAHRLKVKPEV